MHIRTEEVKQVLNSELNLDGLQIWEKELQYLEKFKYIECVRLYRCHIHKKPDISTNKGTNAQGFTDYSTGRICMLTSELRRAGNTRQL